MKKYACLFILTLIGNIAFCQEVIINGDHKNRLLTWEDFTGKPDKSSVHEANTYWKLNYRFQGVSFNGDTARLNGLSVKLELDKEKTWIKPGKETPALLKHEQGHFDIGLLCQWEIIYQFNNTVFLKSDFQNKLQNLLNTILNKYNLMGIKYDEETRHSRDKENQEKWNLFFATELNR